MEGFMNGNCIVLENVVDGGLTGFHQVITGDVYENGPFSTFRITIKGLF